MKRHSDEEVDDRIVKFFEAYDRTQLELIAKKSLELSTLKA